MGLGQGEHQQAGADGETELPVSNGHNRILEGQRSGRNTEVSETKWATRLE